MARLIAQPNLDLTLARCPRCGHEQLELLTDEYPRFGTAAFTLRCEHCSSAAPIGWATKNSYYLFRSVLKAWGVGI